MIALVLEDSFGQVANTLLTIFCIDWVAGTC